MIIIVSFLLLALPLALQAQHCMDDRYAQTALFDSTQVAMIPGEHYATSVRWPGTQVDSLRLDIYMPDANIDPVEKRPLIVMMHGGALLTGQRQDMAYYCMEMARRGFVAATVTYRLGWDCPATDLLGICGMCQSMTHKWRVAMYRGAQDARAAIRHLASRAEELGIDTSFVFLQGEVQAHSMHCMPPSSHRISQTSGAPLAETRSGCSTQQATATRPCLPLRQW
jgi:carboxylesterase type B